VGVGLHCSLWLRPQSTATLPTLSSKCYCGERVPPGSCGCSVPLGLVKRPSTRNSSERMVLVGATLMVGAAMLVSLWLPAVAAQLVGARMAGHASTVPSCFNGQTWTLADASCDSSSLVRTLFGLSHGVPPSTTVNDGTAHCQGCEHEEEATWNAPVDDDHMQSEGETSSGAGVVSSGDSSLDIAVDECTDAAMRCMDTGATTVDCEQCVEVCDSAFHAVEASDDDVQEKQRLADILSCHALQCQGGGEPQDMWE